MNLQDAFVFTHFWLLCGLWVGIGVPLLLYKALTPAISAGRLSHEQRRALLRAIALIAVSICGGFWLLQMSAGAGTPDPMGWPRPQRPIALGMQVLCWTALLLWVHAGRGAGYLAALFAAGDSAAARALAHPCAVRGVVTAIVAAGVAGLWLRTV